MRKWFVFILLIVGISIIPGVIVRATALQLVEPNNIDSTPIKALAPDLWITKAVTPAWVAPGQPITYTLAFSNTGPGIATGVRITDTLPLTISVTDVFSSGVAITNTGSLPAYVWQVTDLAPGQGGVITITGVVSPGVSGDFNLVNQVMIGSPITDTNPVNNTSVVTNTVDGTPPEILATAPISGALDVELAVPVVVTFSEPVITATLSYTVTPDPGGWNEQWNTGGNVVTLTHATFAETHTYTFTIEMVNDLVGHPLQNAPYRWRFTTQHKQYTIYLPLLEVPKVVPAPPNMPRESFWVTDGSVDTIMPAGDRVYIGGDFDYVGPNTGSGAALDAVTGVARSNFPRVNESVLDVVPDNDGGWYILGNFTQVGGLARDGLAHILADGSVDASWHPDVGGKLSVMALSPDGNTLYVAGYFGIIDGQSRNGLAALDTATGQVTSWNPNPNRSEVFDTLVVSPDGSTVYVSGWFTHIGGQPRSYLAALDTVTGQATDWDPALEDGAVYALAFSADGSTIYVAGGWFGHIGGQPRHSLAALDAVTGQATDWNPATDVNGSVYTLALNADGSTLYVGGYFLSIGGQPRICIAALDTVTGQATDWDPHPSGDLSAYVRELVLSLDGSTIYAIGDFTSIGGQPRNHLAALDTVTGQANDWDPHPVDGQPYAMALSTDGSTLYAGGNFTRVGGVPRHNLAVLDAASGQAADWVADTDGLVYALVLSPDEATVYVGGYFTSIDGQPRNGLAALDATTGQVTDWDPNPGIDSLIETVALSPDGSTIYVGGIFTSIGGQPRNHIAALDAINGQVTDWDPNADDNVTALVVSLDGSTVFAGGWFRGIGGQPRDGLTALDANNGQAPNWDPDLPGTFDALALSPDGNTIYAGGSFTRIDAPSCEHLAALDTASGQLTACAISIPNHVHTIGISEDGGVVYVGGWRYIAALDPDGGFDVIWGPNVNEGVYSIVEGQGMVFVGGNFTNFSGQLQPSLAIFDPADLRITKMVTPEVVTPGQLITYTLTFSNTGLGTASDVLIRDVVPITVTATGVSYLGVVPNQVSDYPVYAWQIPELVPGESGVITITGTIDPAVTGIFSLTNRAEIRSGTIDANLLDNVSVVTSTVQAPLADSADYQDHPMVWRTGKLSGWANDFGEVHPPPQRLMVDPPKRKSYQTA